MLWNFGTVAESLLPNWCWSLAGVKGQMFDKTLCWWQFSWHASPFPPPLYTGNWQKSQINESSWIFRMCAGTPTNQSLAASKPSTTKLLSVIKLQRLWKWMHGNWIGVRRYWARSKLPLSVLITIAGSKQYNKRTQYRLLWSRRKTLI